MNLVNCLPVSVSQSEPTRNHEMGIPKSTRTRPSSREEFGIAIICSLPLEYDAVALQFDEFWDEEKDYGRAPGDTNTYVAGRIGDHNVVLVLLPSPGKASAAGAAASIRSSYPRLKLAFLVGTCSGVPGTGEDQALLGDVVISKSLIQFDFGRQYPSSFIAKDTIDDNLGRASKDVRSLITHFETEHGREGLRKKASEYLKDLQSLAARKRRRQRYQYPGIAEDKLFRSDYRHKHRAPQRCTACEGAGDNHCDVAARASCVELDCDEGHVIFRELLETKQKAEPDEMQYPDIFVGRIATGDTVIVSSEHRDRLARQRNVIAFEMEGAGAWDELPCIIIKGISDYADTHQNKIWQPFAAATAASVTKAVLGRYHG